ncbi:MAG: hypothetical protein Q9217_002232 [Psora testacea]
MLASTIAFYLIATAQYIRFGNAFKLTPYNSETCNSRSLGSWVGGPDQGCITGTDAAAGVGASVIIETTGAVDDNFYAVFFDSDDCNPETEMPEGHKDAGCFSGNYGSYAVWDVGS